jgi:PTH1 family peptidyl-tRNA hydrolase
VRLIAGLGNPGKEYRKSRHNLGFRAVELLARKHHARYFWPRYLGRVSRISIGEEEVLLLKPHTYMNMSGKSVSQALRKLNLYPDQLIVIHDDLDLKLGQLKVGFSLKSAGHKGLESIIQETGSKDFFRIRLGIGRPQDRDDVVAYVLQAFAREEEAQVEKMLDSACEAVEVLVKYGLEKAQNLFNARK